MATLALHIIAKDEVEKVKNLINLYEKYFDEIAIAVDERIDEFKLLANDKVKIHEYKWIRNFSDKRNFLADKITSDYYLRLDTDDLIENIEILPELFKQTVARGIDVTFHLYEYYTDENGQCIVSHWRETIIKKRKDIYWKKAIHENIHLDNRENCILARDTQLKIIHSTDKGHAEKAFARNLEYLLEEFNRDGENTDPRTIAYLGRMLAGKGQYREAIKFLTNLIRRSGWNDDKYFAWIQMSDCYQKLGDLETAIACCNEALAINTKFPDAYLQLGNIYLEKQDYDKSVDWYMSGIARPEPDTVIVIDPTFYSYKAKANAAMALLGKGDIEKACMLFEQARKISPNNALIKKYHPLFIEALEEKTFFENLSWISKYIKNVEPNKLEILAEAVPKKSLNSSRVAMLRNLIAKPKKWSEKSIVFYCGNSWEDWADFSVMNGIGGSEEAIIYLSRELVKIGWDVTVYNQCGEFSGIYNGVEYKSYLEFNPRDEFNYFVAWRANIFQHIDIKSKKNILWLHDVPIDLDSNKGNLFDKVIVLSEFHKSLLPNNVREDQIFVSSNGINLNDFKDYALDRNQYRMIYTSSYDRGLQNILEMWPDIKLQVPEAELHIFYGWNTYDKMMDSGRRPKEFKQLMLTLMNQEGIYEHGRVGHRQLVKELQKSAIWAYPSHFEEISCISAMKAQAAGCIPVCTDYAALKETVKEGIKIEGRCDNNVVKEKFKESIIEILKDSSKQEEIRSKVISHKEEFGWDRVANQWTGELFT